MRRLKGPASAHNCPCGRLAQDWAYQGGDPNERVDPKLGYVFSLDPDRYLPMCHSCHLRMDNAHVTACPQGHKYTPENTFLNGGRRACKKCRRALEKRRYAENAADRARRVEYQRRYRERMPREVLRDSERRSRARKAVKPAP